MKAHHSTTTRAMEHRSRYRAWRMVTLSIVLALLALLAPAHAAPTNGEHGPTDVMMAASTAPSLTMTDMTSATPLSLSSGVSSGMLASAASTTRSKAIFSATPRPGRPGPAHYIRTESWNDPHRFCERWYSKCNAHIRRKGVDGPQYIGCVVLKHSIKAALAQAKEQQRFMLSPVAAHNSASGVDGQKVSLLPASIARLRNELGNLDELSLSRGDVSVQCTVEDEQAGELLDYSVGVARFMGGRAVPMVPAGLGHL